MNRYRTENAKINAVCPRNLQNKSAEEIVKYLYEHFRTDVDNAPQNMASAYMQAVSKAIFNPKNWKDPIYAVMPQCGNEWAKAAIVWYHGAEPQESFVGVYSNGYAC